MKKILIIHTGGTISMVSDAEVGVVIDTSTKNPISDETLLKKNTDAFYFVEEPFHLPSPHITPSKMLVISNLIKKYIVEKGITGAVVTHGTDTLEETAYFLELTIDSEIPVVLTGAMRSSNEPGADGPSNLRSAIEVASFEGSVGMGVIVVFNEEIHASKDVTKSHTSNLATFQSPQFGPIGVATKNGVYFHHQPLPEQKFEITSVDKKVPIIKAYSGIDYDLIEYCISMKCDGIVIEALGRGNLPPATLPSIQAAINCGIPVILVSRCACGFASDVYNYEGGGVQLKNMGVIFAKGLNSQKARLKLLVALSSEQKVSLPDIF